MRLVALLRVGRGERPRAVRADPRARRGGPLPGDRRLVDRAGLQHPRRRVVRAAGALRAALPARAVRHHRDDRREPRLVRPQRDDPADPREERHATRTSSCGPGRRRSELPGPLFWWESPDGSRVLAYRIPHEYCAPKDDIGEHVEKAVATLPADRDELRGLLRRRQPRRRPDDARTSSRSRIDARGPPRLELSSLRRFFDAVAAAASCPTCARRAAVPRAAAATRRTPASSAGTAARRTCCSARRSGARSRTRSASQRYPLARARREAWKLLLFNQFHDTLAGTSIEPAYEDARDQIGHASSIAALAFNARGAVDRAPDRRSSTEEEMRPVVVFNPHPWPRARRRRGRVHVAARRRARTSSTTRATAVPMQLTRPLTTMSSDRGRLVFPVELPPLGYRTYRVRARRRRRASRSPRRDTTLENEHAAARARPGDGAHRAARRSRRAAPTSPRRPRRTRSSSTTRSDTWGHGVEAYDRGRSASSSASRCELVETGPVRAILRVESRYGSSTLREDYVLGADAPLRRRPRRARLARAAEAAEAALPDARRRRRARRTRRRTATSSGRRAATRSRASRGSTSPARGRGLTVIERREVRLRRARRRHRHQRRAQPGLGVARPARARGGRRLRVHGPGPADASSSGSSRTRATGATRASSRLAAELNQPPFALIETFHDGPLPQRASYATTAAATSSSPW